MAQTCRQSGLSVVYSDLLEFAGDEIYFSDLPQKLVGRTYKDALFAYETSSIIGVYVPIQGGNPIGREGAHLTQDSSGHAFINPPMDRIFSAGEQLIAISEDDDTVIANGRGARDIDRSLFDHTQPAGPVQEHTLILGWNDIAPRIVAEVDNYVNSDSMVLVVANDPEVDIAVSKLQSEIKNQKIRFVEGDTVEKKTLLDINTKAFDHIIVLSDRGIDIQESDARTLISLLHLRSISESEGVDYSIVTEMLDMRNRELGVVAKADDFVVSDNLISLMLSQLSENRELKKVYDVLFQADGSEVYLKPATRYVKTGTELDFYTVVASAAELGESAIGYRLAAETSNPETTYGVHLNPKKSEKLTLTDRDFIIVLSED